MLAHAADSPSRRNMKAEVEWIVGVLRVGPDYESHGDEYQASCTVVRDGDSAKVMGLSGQFSRETFRAIEKELNKHGVMKAHWTRQKASAIKKKRVSG